MREDEPREPAGYHGSPWLGERILYNYTKDDFDIDFRLLCFDIDRKFDQIIGMLKASLPQEPAKPGPVLTGS
jgi:hypothetical protein